MVSIQPLGERLGRCSTTGQRRPHWLAAMVMARGMFSFSTRLISQNRSGVCSTSMSGEFPPLAQPLNCCVLRADQPNISRRTWHAANSPTFPLARLFKATAVLHCGVCLLGTLPVLARVHTAETGVV